jgi:hypothetical protein
MSGVDICDKLLQIHFSYPLLNLPAKKKIGILPKKDAYFLHRNCYYLPILNILVPQVGQTPWVAGLPFFMVIALAFFISFLARHFTQ